MAEYICPLCLCKHSQSEFKAWPCCHECNCDLPGDIELVDASEFTAGNPVESLIRRREAIQSTEATEEFKSKLLSRIDEIIAMESSMEQGTDQ